MRQTLTVDARRLADGRLEILLERNVGSYYRYSSKRFTQLCHLPPGDTTDTLERHLNLVGLS